MWTGRRRSRRRRGLRGSAPFGDAPAIAVAFEGDDLGVVDEAIDEGRGGGGVGEDGRPLAERQVRREREAAPFIAAADDREEEIRGPGVVGEGAEA